MQHFDPQTKVAVGKYVSFSVGRKSATEFFAECPDSKTTDFEQWWKDNWKTKKIEQWWKDKDHAKKIPFDPDVVYKEHGWVSWGDWVHSYLSFADARKSAIELFAEDSDSKLKRDGFEKWWKDRKHPKRFPSEPDAEYKKRGWVSWKDWVGVRVVEFPGIRREILDIVVEFCETNYEKVRETWIMVEYGCVSAVSTLIIG